MADSSGRSTAKPEDRERGTPDALDASLDPAPTFTPIDTSRGRFKRNVLANLIYFVFNAGIQLWFVRYLIANLGVATYGLVPLATNITNYMAIITVSLSGSVGRFLTIDLARGDLATANRTFNTSLFASIVLAVALLPVAGALSWFAPSFLDIPAGEEMGTRFLLMCTCFAFLLNAVGSNFACSTFAKNRFDVQRVIDALGFITQVGVILALFTWAEGDLWYVGAGIAASAVVRQIGYQVSWRRLTPELSMRLASFDRTRLREILGMGGWLVAGQSGWVLQRQLDLLLVNVLVGASVAGGYAAITQLVVVIGAVHGMALGALSPTVIASHCNSDGARVIRLTRIAGLLPGLALAAPIGLICGLGPWLLHLWLGPRFAGLWPLLCTLIAPLAPVYAKGPLDAVFQAHNRLATPTVALVSMGALHLALAWVLVRHGSMGAQGVAVSQALTYSLGLAVIPAIYAARILNTQLRAIVTSQALALLAAGTVALVAWLAGRIVAPHGWWGLAAVACAVLAVYLPVSWLLVLSEEDRSAIRSLVVRPAGPNS